MMTQTRPSDFPTRRVLLAGGAGLLSLAIVRPAYALPEDIAGAIREFVGDAPITRGRIRLDLPPLVENGNSVSMTVKVDSPMTSADYVKTISVFNEKNPQPNVANFHLSPHAGRAEVSARIRLATSQTITAIARMSDGGYWSDSVEVIVTIAACTEE
jgi:sulfur-oxidizing protein SoxY